MRPLFFEEENNEALLTKSDGYLWGNDFLIYPVTTSNQKTKEVYFPNTANWYDFYTGKKYQGGTTQIVQLNEDNIPTFVRGGSFIPMAKLVQTTDSYNLEQFDLHFYFDDSMKISSGKLFNDDGYSTNTFKDNKFEKVTFRSKFKAEKLEIRVASDHEFISNTDKDVTLKIHNISQEPRKIRINKKRVKYTWNSNLSLLEIKVRLINDKKAQIEIQF